MFRLLVVDDNAAFASLLEEVFKTIRRPYELRVARDGDEALEFLRGIAVAHNWFPHLILLDINMPRVNGLAALREIKSDPRLCVIPVLMISTTSEEAEVYRAYQWSANGFVQKPADLNGLVRLVQAIETFWMEVAIPPTANSTPERLNLHFRIATGEPPRETGSTGQEIAGVLGE